MIQHCSAFYVLSVTQPSRHCQIELFVEGRHAGKKLLVKTGVPVTDIHLQEQIQVRICLLLTLGVGLPRVLCNGCRVIAAVMLPV